MDLTNFNATIFVCANEDLAIGKDNQLLYHIKEDMHYFKRNTLATNVVMGRKTFESLPNGPLLDRTNLVITNSKSQIDGCDVINNVAEWIGQTGFGNYNIIGGEKIYKIFLPFVNVIIMTKVFDRNKDADAFFPEFEEWFHPLHVSEPMEDEKTGLKYQYIKYGMDKGALYQPVFDAFRDFLILRKVKSEFEEAFEKAQHRPMSFIAKNHENNNASQQCYHTLASSTFAFLTCSSSSFIWSKTKRGQKFWFDFFTDFKKYLIDYLVNNV